MKDKELTNVGLVENLLLLVVARKAKMPGEVSNNKQKNYEI